MIKHKSNLLRSILRKSLGDSAGAVYFKGNSNLVFNENFVVVMFIYLNFVIIPDIYYD